MIKNPVKVGRKYKIVGFSSFGGGMTSDPSGRVLKGKSYECISDQSLAGKPVKNLVAQNTITLRDEFGNALSMYLVDLMEGAENRKEHAKEVLEEIEQKKKEIAKLERLYEKLSMFETDEEEYATMIVKAIKGADSEKESIKNLSVMLKERFEYLESKA